MSVCGQAPVCPGGHMHSSEGSSTPSPRIPRVAPDWDPAGSALSPVEGFLLSRVDGRTDWTELREIGGLPPEDVDRTLERWIAEGILVLEPLAAQDPERQGADPADPRAGGPQAGGGLRATETDVQAELDPALDIPVDLQQRILAFEADLERPYCELLGVARDADAREIKLAYFRLSKVYHPDRYFRREIGRYQLRLERIFKKLVEAYELLSDPATRAEIERSMEAGPPPTSQTEAQEQAAAPSEQATAERAPEQPPGYRTPSRLENLERLRRRFRIPPKLLAERQFRARQFFNASQVAVQQESWSEAAASIRLAIAFDPWNPEYKESFAEVQAGLQRVRAAELLRDLDPSMDDAGRQEAMRLLEEALHYRPADAELNHRAAQLALDLKDPERAREYAEAACEFGPETAAHFATLCRVLRRTGLKDRAHQALDTARKLDPEDPQVVAECEQLGRRNRKK